MSNQDTLINRRAALMGALGKVELVVYIADAPASGFQAAMPQAFNDQMTGSDRERQDSILRLSIFRTASNPPKYARTPYSAVTRKHGDACC